MSLPDGERIAKLEQSVVDLTATVNNVALDVKEIKGSLQNQIVLQGEINNLKSEIVDLKKEIGEAIKRNGFWKWFGPTLSAAAGAVLAVLIANFIQHGGR